MARYQYCPPCEMGDHKNHYKVVHAVSEGMIGGVVCNCKGECRKDAPKRREDMLREAGLLREGEATTLAVEAQHKTRRKMIFKRKPRQCISNPKPIGCTGIAIRGSSFCPYCQGLINKTLVPSLWRGIP